MDCSDGHEASEKEREAHYEAEDVLVVTSEPSRG